MCKTANLKNRKLVFNTNNRLMQGKRIAECSKESILQYFWPSLSYHLSQRYLFCLFLSSRFTQVLQYVHSLFQICDALIYLMFALNLYLLCYASSEDFGETVGMYRLV